MRTAAAPPPPWLSLKPSASWQQPNGSVNHACLEEWPPGPLPTSSDPSSGQWRLCSASPLETWGTSGLRLWTILAPGPPLLLVTHPASEEGRPEARRLHCPHSQELSKALEPGSRGTFASWLYTATAPRSQEKKSLC